MKPKAKPRNRMHSFFIVVIVFFIFWYMARIGSIDFHEQAHEAIFRSYNISSQTHINFLKAEGYTTGETGKCVDDCILAQNLNEVVGYNIDSVIFSLWMMLFSYIIIKKTVL